MRNPRNTSIILWHSYIIFQSLFRHQFLLSNTLLVGVSSALILRRKNEESMSTNAPETSLVIIKKTCASLVPAVGLINKLHSPNSWRFTACMSTSGNKPHLGKIYCIRRLTFWCHWNQYLISCMINHRLLCLALLMVFYESTFRGVPRAFGTRCGRSEN